MSRKPSRISIGSTHILGILAIITCTGLGSGIYVLKKHERTRNTVWRQQDEEVWKKYGPIIDALAAGDILTYTEGNKEIMSVVQSVKHDLVTCVHADQKRARSVSLYTLANELHNGVSVLKRGWSGYDEALARFRAERRELEEPIDTEKKDFAQSVPTSLPPS